MLRVLLHKLLHGVPQTGNGLVVLVQTDDEAVLLIVLFHVSERVETDVAEQFDARFNPPVELIWLHQFMAVEKARLVPTHVSVALRVAVDDLPLSHILPNLPGLAPVDPFRIGPVLVRDEAVVSLPRHQGGGDLLKLVVKLLVVQEDPVVIVVTVETVLDLPNRLGDVPYIRVTGQGDEGRVHTIRVGARAGRGVLWLPIKQVIRGVGRWLGGVLLGAWFLF